MEIKDYFTIGIAALGLILGIINFYGNRFVAKNEMFRWDSSKEMINARHKVRTEDNLSVHNEYVPEIMNYYDYWGLMVRQHHLSLKVFNSSSGTNVIEMYRKLSSLILKERERSPLYAKDFEWLYNKVLNKYPDVAKTIDSEGNPINISSLSV